MPTRPVQGGSNGTWGTELNAWLDAAVTPYNVKADYGATGNGSTDDTTAIQNAVSAAVSAGGGVVYFPPGTYALGQQTTSPLAFIDNPNILISGASNVSLIGAPGAKLTAKTGANLSAILMLYNCSNIEVGGLGFVGNNTGLTGGQNNGAIALESVVNVHIHDCVTSVFQGSHIVGDWIFNTVVENLQSHLSVSGSTCFDVYWVQDFTVRECDLRGGAATSTTGFQNSFDSVASGSNATSETLSNSVSNNIWLVRNRISGFQTGINMADAADVVIEDNNIHDNSAGSGANFWGALIQSTTATKPTTNIKLVNNRIYQNGAPGVNVGAGVCISPNGNSAITATLTDNEIFDNQADAICLNSANTTLYARRNRFFSRNNANQTTVLANGGFLTSSSIVTENDGYNPRGWATSTPGIPAGTGSGNKVTNTNPYPATVYLNGGSGIHIISAAGTDTAISGGAQNVLTLQPQDAIYFATANTSGWAWYGI